MPTPCLSRGVGIVGRKSPQGWRAQREEIAKRQAAQQFQNTGFLNPEGDTDIDFNPFEWQPTRAWNSSTGEWEVQPNQNARWNFHWNRWEDSGDQASWEGFNDWIENKDQNENYRFNHLSDRLRYINPEFLTEENTRGFRPDGRQRVGKAI